MNPKLQKTLDALVARWNDIDAIVTKAGRAFELPSKAMKVERALGGKMKLMYDGRPLAECKAIQKIEAVQYIPELLAVFQEVQSNILTDAETALLTLERVLPEFEAIQHLAKGYHYDPSSPDVTGIIPVSRADLSEDARNQRQLDANNGER